MVLIPLNRFYLTILVSLFVSASASASSVAPCAATDLAALQWLDRMSRSIREVSFQGVVMLQRDNEMQVMRISHSVHGDSSSELLTQLTGQGARVERGSHQINCIHPGDRLLRFDTLSESGQCGIAKQYRLSVSDGERVAGRKAVRIQIEPRDMYRFGYIMSLDRETGLLLKSQTFTHGYDTLETMQFANLSYTDPVPGVSDVEVVHEARHPPHGNPAPSLSVGMAWTVGWLPRGFTATDSPPETGGRRTYTDGLAVFSVFLEDLGREIRPGEGLVRRGGTTSYTRGMRLAGQPVLVTVIGEVPVNTARMVADSVVWVQ